MTAKNKWIHCGYIKEEEKEKGQLFVCVKCDVKCSNKYNFDRHCLSSKHNRTKEEQKEVDNDLFMCECGKKYKYSQGLSKHKLCCVLKQDQTEELTVDSGKQLIETLLKQNTEQTRMNAELHAKVIELCKIGTINNINCNNNNNNTHKTFNLQFFLNETCKDAVNLEDFAKAVVLQLSDIDKIGEIGYVDGMAGIIETKLNSLGVHKRPIHCTDAKREVFYVKDSDKWGKDDGNKMRALIKRMDRKLAPLLITFNNNHANKGYSSDSEHNKHQQIIIEIVGGKNDDEQNEDAIIRSISKKTLIEKSNL
jgi:hypothetical protein